MKAMQNVWGRRAAASGLALLMAAALPVTALADGPGEAPTPEYLAYMEKLQDNHMEYEEIPDLIKNFYGPIKSSYDMLEQSKESQAMITTCLLYTSRCV